MKRYFAFAALLILFFAACPDPAPTRLDPPDLAAPVNGSTISQNPPTFIWHAVSEAQILYQFEVASDPQFGNIVFSSLSIFPPDTSCTPDSALATGTFYWHVCVMEDC